MITQQEIQAVLKKMSKEKNTKMFKRYQTIYLRLKGRQLKEIADIVRVSRKTVNNYIKAYKKDGLDGLIPGKSTGQPKFLTDQQENQLKNTIVNNVPADLSFTATYNWNANIVRKYIENTYGISFSRTGANKLLHRLGFSFTRPTYTLEKADPQKQEQFKKDFEEVKKN